MKANLLLQDGTLFTGKSFGAEGEKCGEVVFNTSMCGYQEILTDPSYRDQIITMTYPLQGNYGTNTDDVESDRVQVAGFVVKENSAVTSSWRSEKSLSRYLKDAGVMGIEGLDTRMLVRHIREKGAMNGII
jgi:carbamoyl-phosphate synthase small subunit